MGKEEDLATAAAAAGVAKSAPLVVVSGMKLAGYSLNDWVLAATLMWIAVQMGWFIWSNIIKPRRQRDSLRAIDLLLPQYRESNSPSLSFQQIRDVTEYPLFRQARFPWPQS
ncbi:TPA: hypothetical protein ACSP71_001787 [Aeromonas hydrophila]|uniref:hypothetical protein n=1 Tax=Aeromonas hydrophila TaxID=644 RepID=UPI002B4A705A|nr:hypothetical protein [Aeromonas hydrophila]